MCILQAFSLWDIYLDPDYWTSYVNSSKLILSMQNIIIFLNHNIWKILKHTHHMYPTPVSTEEKKSQKECSISGLPFPTFMANIDQS